VLLKKILRILTMMGTTRMLTMKVTSAVSATLVRKILPNFAAIRIPPSERKHQVIYLFLSTTMVQVCNLGTVGTLSWYLSMVPYGTNQCCGPVTNMMIGILSKYRYLYLDTVLNIFSSQNPLQRCPQATALPLFREFKFEMGLPKLKTLGKKD